MDVRDLIKATEGMSNVRVIRHYESEEEELRDIEEGVREIMMMHPKYSFLMVMVDGTTADIYDREKRRWKFQGLGEAHKKEYWEILKRMKEERDCESD